MDRSLVIVRSKTIDVNQLEPVLASFHYAGELPRLVRVHDDGSVRAVYDVPFDKELQILVYQELKDIFPGELVGVSAKDPDEDIVYSIDETMNMQDLYDPKELERTMDGL